jgi:hypothetical protein
VPARGNIQVVRPPEHRAAMRSALGSVAVLPDTGSREPA